MAYGLPRDASVPHQYRRSSSSSRFLFVLFVLFVSADEGNPLRMFDEIPVMAPRPKDIDLSVAVPLLQLSGPAVHGMLSI